MLSNTFTSSTEHGSESPPSLRLDGCCGSYPWGWSGPYVKTNTPLHLIQRVRTEVMSPVPYASHWRVLN